MRGCDTEKIKIKYQVFKNVVSCKELMTCLHVLNKTCIRIVNRV